MKKGEHTFNFSKTTSLFENPWSTTHSAQSWVSIVTHGPQRSWLSGACIWREKHKENVVGEQCTCSWGSVVGGGVTFDLCHKKSQERGVWAPKLKDKGKEKERSLGLGKDRHWAVGQIAGGWESEGRLDRSTRSLLLFLDCAYNENWSHCRVFITGVGGNGSQKAMMGEERNAICYFCCPFTLCYWSPGGLKPC